MAPVAMKPGEFTVIRLADCTTRNVPLASVQFDCKPYKGSAVVCVLDSLPEDVLLGNDIATPDVGDANEAFVVTRSMTRHQGNEKEPAAVAERVVNVQSIVAPDNQAFDKDQPIDAVQLVPQPEALVDKLVNGAADTLNGVHQSVERDVSNVELTADTLIEVCDLNPEQVRDLQLTDTTMDGPRKWVIPSSQDARAEDLLLLAEWTLVPEVDSYQKG